jgi:hypothetical protein
MQRVHSQSKRSWLFGERSSTAQHSTSANGLIDLERTPEGDSDEGAVTPRHTDDGSSSRKDGRAGRRTRSVWPFRVRSAGLSNTVAK